MLRLLLTPEAQVAMRQLGSDTTRLQLWQAIARAIRLIRTAPDTREARAVRFDSDTAGVVWGVPVRVGTETDDWLVLWYPADPDAVVVLYIGEDPR